MSLCGNLVKYVVKVLSPCLCQWNFNEVHKGNHPLASKYNKELQTDVRLRGVN